jgi:stage V sporulation protein AD
MFNFKDIYINDWFSIVGPIEDKSNLKNYNLAMKDYYYGEKTFEKAEIKMQNIILNYLLKSNKPDLIIGSDLMNQLSITNMSLVNRNIPYLGLYSACASSVGGIINLSLLVDSKKIKEGLYITSSHNLNAEKQFRFPIEYGAPKPKRATFTTTGAIGLTISKKESNIKIINGTIGSVVDSYVKDVFNMGAVMAPSAVDTLLKHLEATKTTVNDYDLILTGDLGEVGMRIFTELLKEKNIKLKNYIDAGTLIYHNKEYSGGSGPVVLPLVLLNNIIYNKKYKKILLLATGSLHSPVLVNQKNSIPAITHALTIEVIK